MRKSAGKHRSFLKLFILGCLVILVSFILLVLKLGFLNIKYIEILNNNLLCVDYDQLKRSVNVQNKNLLFLDTKKITKEISQKFACIKDVKISKVLPDRIKVEVITGIPAAVLLDLGNVEATGSAGLEDIATPSAQQSANSNLVDQDGVVISKISEKLDLPNIYVDDGSFPQGKEMESKSLENVLKILNKTRGFGIDIKTSEIYGNSLIVFSLPKIIFNLGADINIQIASLQLILEKAKIDRVKLEFIDLRFDKPIVKFAPLK